MDSKMLTLDGYLREQTATIHKRTEKVLEPLELFTNFNLKNYGTFVLIQYRWHSKLEQILAKAEPSLIFDGYTYLPKVELLRKDLKALDINTESIQYGANTDLEIPGIIYVLEGSMLGGTMISNHLEECGVDLKYRHYFSCCKEAARKEWPLTKKYLQAIDRNDSDFEMILESSLICFELMMDIAVAEINLSLE